MKSLSLLVLGMWSLTAAAQVPVFEAGGGAVQGQTPVVLAQAANPNNELTIRLYNQLEALQSEVQTLRGIVEEQAFQLRRMETEQRDRYLDIDRRLSSINTGDGRSDIDALGPPLNAPDLGITGGAPGSSGGSPGAPLQGGFDTTGSNTNPPPAVRNDPLSPVQIPPANAGAQQQGVDVAAANQMDEQELYRTALALLLEQNEYEQSISLFQNYIRRFPQGRYLTNAYYWQGEALLLVSRYDEARDAFNKILTDFPQDPKAAGAMLKLGVTYQQMGDRARAASTWQELSTRYPENLTEIGFAQDYLNKL